MTAVVFLVLLGLVLGLIIGIAVQFFGTEVDPRLEEIEELLPGANCGACGFAGCADFSRSLLVGKAQPTACTSNTAEAADAICVLLGVAAGAVTPRVAVVRCGGDNRKAKQMGLYNGITDCRGAVLVAGGAKGCLYGCLGLASCSRGCPFNAIEITNDGIAVVHPDLCTGCGHCVATCPRKLIALVPKSAPLHVLCHSPEKGGVKSKVCKASCIGCRKCVKAAEDGQMQIDGFLASVNYDSPPAAILADVCPTGCLLPSLLDAPASSAESLEEREVVDA